MAWWYKIAMQITRLFLLVMLLVPAAALVAAESTDETYVGKVVRIADGDTITVLVGKNQHRVRLEGIDCPERAQPFGKKASQFTSKLVFGKTVRVRSKGKDLCRSHKMTRLCSVKLSQCLELAR